MSGRNKNTNPRRSARSWSDLDSVMTAPSAAVFWKRFEEAAADLGFPFYIYVFVRRDGTRFHHTNIEARHYAGPEHDPFLEYCCNNLGHTLTGAEYMLDYSFLGPGEHEFIRRAQGCGMRTGIGIPVRTRNNPEYGGFNLGTPLDRKTFEDGPVEMLEVVRTLCLAAQQRIDELKIVENAPRRSDALALGTLTPRERQIYDLLTSGLNRAAVADRAGISPHTAATHIKRIYSKLGVRSQAEAIALRA